MEFCALNVDQTDLGLHLKSLLMSQILNLINQNQNQKKDEETILNQFKM